jgi:hypothetical protein
MGGDGISYLMAAKRNGIRTPLSAPYELEILAQQDVLEEAALVQSSRPPRRRMFLGDNAGQ